MKRRYSWPLWTLAGVVVLLVALHFALPYLVRDYLNDKLADMGDYRGQITDVDLALWRGAYKINGLKIVKVDGKVPVPFVDAPLIDLSVSWHSLWYDHAVVAQVQFLNPEINFVDAAPTSRTRRPVRAPTGVNNWASCCRSPSMKCRSTTAVSLSATSTPSRR